MTHPIRDYTDTHKLCTRCQAMWPHEDFYKTTSGTLGLNSECKPCRSARMKEYRSRRGDDVRARELTYRQKHSAEFAARGAEWVKKNPDRHRANGRKWAEANRERLRSIKQAWLAANPDAPRLYAANRRQRKRLAPGTLSTDIAVRLFSEQNGRCKACSADLGVVGYHVDHIKALACGGANSDENVQLLCPSCNRSKRTLDFDEFLRRKGLAA